MSGPVAVPSSVGSDARTVDRPLDFDTWYPQAWPRLLGAVASMVGDQAEAQDVAAQAMAKAYENWERLDDPAAWAYQVAVNLVRKAWRRRVRERSEAGRWVEPPALLPDVSPELWRAVGALPRRQRIAIALRYVLDLPQDEIAQAMGIAPGTVAATLHSARRRLRAELGAEGWT
jgi:RNA polymerase sigma-70 factor (ECF subfamily)